MKTLLVAFLSLAALVCATSASAKPGLFWCTFTLNEGTGHTNHYVDYVDDSLVHADDMSYAAVNHAWSAYIRSTYSVPDSTLYGRCDLMSADAPGGPTRFISQSEQGWKASGHTIIHVNWTYAAPTTTSQPQADYNSPVTTNHTPSSGPPPPGWVNPWQNTQHRITVTPSQPAAAQPAHPAAVPAPAAQPRPDPTPVARPTSAAAAHPASTAAARPANAFHCVLYTKQGDHGVRYSSNAILTDASFSALKKPWMDYVRETYHVTDSRAYGGCQPISAPPDRREAAVDSTEQHWRSMNIEVIHVNWTSAPLH